MDEARRKQEESMTMQAALWGSALSEMIRS